MSEDPYQSANLENFEPPKGYRLKCIQIISRRTFWITFILGLSLGIFFPLLGYYIPSDGSAKAAAQTRWLKMGTMIANGIFVLAVPSGIIALTSTIVCAFKKDDE